MNTPKVKRDYFPQVDGDWFDRLLVLWEEDDAPVLDKERTGQAFERISGRPVGAWVAKVQVGDHAAYLHRNGWVHCIYPEGGCVAVVIKEA